ncbi:MAG: hypothetical protein AB1765_08600 [Candidatus Hydrogenedentota bacterium]
MLNQVEYYWDKNVRRCIGEYCGGDFTNPKSFTAEYLVGYGEAMVWEGKEEGWVSTPKDGFHWILDKGLDIFRSVWDRRNTLSVIDVEYFNVDFGGEIYFKQKTTFRKLENFYRCIMDVYKQYGLNVIVLVTGQGYHFVTKVTRDSEAEKMLTEIGYVIPSLAGKYEHPNPGSRRARPVVLNHGKCFDGMGKVMEYLSQKLIREAHRWNVDLPIVTTDVAVGSGRTGREAVSIDLSMYADPIFMRDIRCAFSSHQKHKVQRYKVGDRIADRVPVQITLPRGGLSLDDLFELRRHFRNSANYAANCNCMIPASDQAFVKLIEEYKKSELYKFHQDFDKTQDDPWFDWHKTYNRFNLHDIPPCTRYALQFPNPHLMKPTNLQNLARCLLSIGWHPKHIAGLVRSKYEQDYGWGKSWDKYDAASRAFYYIRMFCGQVTTGLDQGIDHNCISQKQKGYCLQPFCGYDLGKYFPGNR